MKKERSISVAKIWVFLRNIEKYGSDGNRILQGAEIHPSILASPDGKVTSSAVRRIFLSAARLTKNENIGLLQGESLARGFSSVLGHLLMNCRSLGEAIEKFCTYEKTVDETSHTALKKTGMVVEFSNTSTEPALAANRQLSDFKIAGSLSYMRLLTGGAIEPSRVSFTHQARQTFPNTAGSSTVRLISNNRSMPWSLIDDCWSFRFPSRIPNCYRCSRKAPGWR